MIGAFQIATAFICHPNPTLGYRITCGQETCTYLTDHEPALDTRLFSPFEKRATASTLAAGADVLIHDAQYSSQEYQSRIGWGHSSIADAIAFATQADVKQLVLFHHDPAHTDEDLENLVTDTLAAVRPSFPVTIGAEGMVFALGSQRRAA
jgi:phosphoribosyl 1,2-cyclic phosphodiesterase